MNPTDYTSVADEVFEATKFKGYKFRRDRKLSSWLRYSFGLLFKRHMTDWDIDMLVHTLEQRRDIKNKMLCKGFNKLSYEERTALKCKWIGADGYVYMRKVIPFNEAQCKKWEVRDKHMFDDLQKRNELREKQEMQELKSMALKQHVRNNYYVKGGKILKR